MAWAAGIPMGVRVPWGGGQIPFRLSPATMAVWVGTSPGLEVGADIASDPLYPRAIEESP